MLDFGIDLKSLEPDAVFKYSQQKREALCMGRWQSDRPTSFVFLSNSVGIRLPIQGPVKGFGVCYCFLVLKHLDRKQSQDSQGWQVVKPPFLEGGSIPTSRR